MSSPPDKGGTGHSEMRRRKTRSQTKKKTNDNKKGDEDTENKLTKTNEEDKNKPASESGVDNPPIPPQEAAAQGFPQQQAGSQGFPQPQPTLYQDVLVVPPNRIIFAIPKWMVFTATAIIGIIFVIAGGFLGDKIYKAYFLPGQMIPNMTFSAVGKDGWEFFKKYDRDGDYRLSLDEYEAIYHTLVANGINVSLH
jgi:hypothetical protein